MAGPRSSSSAPERKKAEDDILNILGETPEGEEEEIESGEEEEESESEEAEEEEGDDDGEAEEGEEEEGEEEGEREVEVKVKADKRGNLINPKTGKIVAPAGVARRFYEDAVDAKKQVAALSRSVQQRDSLLHQARDAIISMQAQLTGVNSRDDVGKTLGLSPDEQVEFLHLGAQFKDNGKALDALRYLLTKAVQRGIDIKPLGAGGAAFDPSVIVNDMTKKIEASLKPMNDRFQESEKQEQTRKAVQQEIQNFTLRNPEAEQYLPVIGEILKNPRFSHLGLEGAWLTLQNHLLRKNLTARQSRRPVGRPAGRARAGVPNDGGHIDDSPASVDMEFKDILKSVIRDYGDVE